ncbi:hypothetical protein BGZ95_001346 [Linnemannia exigua]|uniref:Uncharacterized protein n=1 Tax=Linnemannia exigua TaxID=604196 RepID=A0AAD4H3Q4_9FUNG|nr:hypothetical protein BGZ95_001346 [Linnemannia exigua]
MKCPTLLSIISTISILTILSSVALSRLTDGVYTIRSHQGSYLADNKTVPGDLVEYIRDIPASVSALPHAQWTVVQNKEASSSNLFSIRNRHSNLFLSLDHSMDTKRNPYRDDEPVRLQKEYQDWYLDSTETAGYYDIESPVMGHQEKAYAIKSPEGAEGERERRGLTLKDVVALPSTHRGWLFEAVKS